MKDQLLFSSASVLDLLANIKELEQYDITLDEQSNGVTIKIGDSEYAVSNRAAEKVVVDDNVLEEIDEITSEAFEDIVAPDALEHVEGGILSGLAKTLLIGGMVRLSSKLLKE